MTALAWSRSLLVTQALWRRSLNEVLRVRGALLPATIAPVVFLLGMSGQFGRLTGLEGFPTDSYLSWVVPLSCLQGAGFAGAATGANLARDIEQGLFDRFLVAPVPRSVLIVGPILGAVTRSLVPATVVLVVGLALGADLSGGLSLGSFETRRSLEPSWSLSRGFTVKPACDRFAIVRSARTGRFRDLAGGSASCSSRETRGATSIQDSTPRGLDPATALTPSS